MELLPNPEQMRHMLRSPRRPDLLRISPRNNYRLKRRDRSEEDEQKKIGQQLFVYHKKKRTEKFVRSETNHRVMTKAELAGWEKEVERAHPDNPKTCGGAGSTAIPGIALKADPLHRSALLREKENVDFILNNETFELAEEEISPAPEHNKKRHGAKSPLRLELDVSVIGMATNRHHNTVEASFTDPLSPSTMDISIIVPPSRSRSSVAQPSASSTKRLALSHVADPLTPVVPAQQPTRRYARRGKTRPTCKLSTIPETQQPTPPS